MRVIVPFDASDPKTRLAPVLSAQERRAFADAMLSDVLAAIDRAGHDAHVITTAEVDVPTPTTVDTRPLSTALNDALSTVDRPVAIVMADLPLVTSHTVSRLFDAEGDLVIAPGLGGGTNALVIRTPAFHVDYHGASCRKHREIADRLGLSVTECDSRRLATDIDEPADLREVLLHTDGRAARWLQDRDFSIAVSSGRVSADRKLE